MWDHDDDDVRPLGLGLLSEMEDALIWVMIARRLEQGLKQ